MSPLRPIGPILLCLVLSACRPAPQPAPALTPPPIPADQVPLVRALQPLDHYEPISRPLPPK